MPAGETIGYGAIYKVQRASRIATIACGYADGFLRALSVASTSFQRALPGKLDGRAICHGIGERQTQLDHIDARAWQALHHGK